MLRPLPSTGTLLLMVITSIAIMLLPDVVLSRPLAILMFKVVSVILFLTLMIISTLNTFLTPRRCLGLLAYLLMLMVPAEVLLDSLFNEHGLMYAMAVPLIMMLYILALDSMILAVILSIVSIIMPFSLMWIVLNKSSLTILIAFIASISAGISITGTYIWKINRIKHAINIKPLILAKAFFTSWLTNDHKLIESIFQKLSRSTKVKIHGIYFKRINGEDVALILPQIHYGPYRQVGSSAVPHQLYFEGMKRGVYILALHGPGSHELNVATYNDAKKLVSYVINSLSEIEVYGTEIQPLLPRRISKGSWDILVVPFTNVDLIFVTRPNKGIDDLPINLWKYAIDKETKKLIVDLHNVMLKETPTINEIKELEKIIEACISSKGVAEFMVGYGESIVDDPYNSLCLNKVVTLLLAYDKERYALIYLFGNNAEEGVRDSIRKLIGKLGLKDVEVITPDDHVCAATIAFEPYLPVKYSRQLIKGVLDSAKQALNNLKPAKAYYFELDIDDVPTLGDGVYKLLESLRKVGSFVSKTIKKKISLTYLIQMIIIITITSII